MRLVKMLVVLLLVPAMLWAQSTTGSTSTTSDTPNVSEQITKLSEAIAAQQAQIAEQQKQLEAMRKQLAEQKAAATTAPHVVDASLNTTNATTVAAQAPPGGAPQPEAQGTGKTSPLSFRIGAAEFTPGGFLDFTNVFRSTNTGSIVSTGFGGIPFGNTAAGHLTEIRTTSQYSRLSLKMASKVLGGDMTGYVEADFNGNDAATVFQSSQNHTMRVRLAYMEYKRGPVQLIGGQTWGWLTPNRVGLGTAGTDVMITNNSDANINVGLAYSRPSSLHVILRPNEHIGWGFGIETQQQFIGATGAVVLPTAFAGVAGSVDGNAGVPGAPSLHPGVLTKLAFDSDPKGRNIHLEVAGILNSDKISITPVGAPAGTFVNRSKTGGGIQPAAVISLSKKFRVVGNVFYGNGQGRQIIALGPDFVVRPDGNISLVHSGTGMAGVELQVTPNTLIAGYYGVAYFQRNFFQDTTSAAAVKPIIGYGCDPRNLGTAGIPFTVGTGLCPTNLVANRSIQEPTLDISHAFWKNPQWGSLVMNMQTSYLTRSPWVAGQNPKNAHTFMQYVVLRYILP